MTTGRPQKGLADHDLFTGVLPYSHHAEMELTKVQVNGTVIVPGDHEYRVAWTHANHIITEACLVSPNTSPIAGGRLGAWNSGTQTIAQSGGEHLAGGGTYVYVASFMRLHGDGFLSRSSIFGTSIAWKDIYLDGDETVILMRNTSGINQTMRFWGLCWAK